METTNTDLQNQEQKTKVFDREENEAMRREEIKKFQALHSGMYVFDEIKFMDSKRELLNYFYAVQGYFRNLDIREIFETKTGFQHCDESIKGFESSLELLCDNFESKIDKLENKAVFIFKDEIIKSFGYEQTQEKKQD